MGPVPCWWRSLFFIAPIKSSWIHTRKKARKNSVIYTPHYELIHETSIDVGNQKGIWF